MNDNSRYDIENKSNRFMEFVSREMIRRNKNRSYAEQPKANNNPMFSGSGQEKNSDNNNSFAEIYSQAQLPRYRRGASLLRSNSKSNNNSSLSKYKKELKDTSLNFYEGLKSKEKKAKPKQETTPNIGSLNEDDYNLEQLHYEMVRMHQNMKKLQSHI